MIMPYAVVKTVVRRRCSETGKYDQSEVNGLPQRVTEIVETRPRSGVVVIDDPNG